MEMTKTIQELKAEFNKEIETLRMSQAEMKMELKYPEENSKEIRMTQSEDEVYSLEEISMEDENKDKNTEKGHAGNEERQEKGQTSALQEDMRENNLRSMAQSISSTRS